MKKRNWVVVNDKGEIAGSNLDKWVAEDLAERMDEMEPNAGWTALTSKIGE